MSPEVWRKVRGYRNYSVSNLGRVRNDKTQRILKPFKSKGRYRVSLYEDGDPEVYLVSRLVADAFVPNPERKREVMHKNGDVTDNAASNLEWATHDEIMKRTCEMGYHGYPEEAKRRIRELYATGKYTQSELSRLFGIGQSNISKWIQQGKK